MDDATGFKRNNTILIYGAIIAFLYYPLIGHLVFLGRGYTFNTILFSRLFIWLEVIILFISCV